MPINNVLRNRISGIILNPKNNEARCILYLNGEVLRKTKPTLINGIFTFKFRVSNVNFFVANFRVMYNGKRVNLNPYVKRRLQIIQTSSIKKVLFFQHLPKCGGTSLRSYLYNFYRPEDVFPTTKQIKSIPGIYHNEKIVRDNHFSKLNQSLLITGHYSSKIRQQIGAEKIITTTLLRDPIDRAFSNLYHLIRHDKRMANKSQIEVSRLAKVQISNSITRYLSGSSSKPILDESDLKLAIINLDKIDHVIFNDYIEVGVNTLLSNHFEGPDHYDSLGTTFEFPVKNVNPNKKDLYNRDSDIGQTLIDLNYLDLQLYDYAKKQSL